MVFLAVVGYQLNFGESGKKLNNHFFETVILREIDKNPHNAGLFSALGDLYYDRRSFAEAIAAYSHAIALEPENTHALNNLAWLLATCEDVRLRDAEKSLALAFRAAAIESAPYILDTLAESLYINGRVEEAIEAETAALSKATANRGYYEEQLRKMKARRPRD
jgi:Flp pilus assembly protein TadD